ncbi:hypothetical protein ACJ41O_002396 [Fusarium nematophilum]
MDSPFQYQKPGGVSQDSADELSADPDTMGHVIKMPEQNCAYSRGNLNPTTPRGTSIPKALQRCFTENLSPRLRHMTRRMRFWMIRADASNEALKLADRKNQELCVQNKKLTERVNALVGKLEETNEELDKALLERDQGRRMADGGALADSTKATDDSIRSQWKLLAYNVRGLAHSLAKDPPSQQLGNVVTERLSFVEQSYHELLQDQDYREPLMEGYLWCLIAELVLDSGHAVWGGPGTADLKAVQDAIISQIGEPRHTQNASLYLQRAAKWLAQGSTILYRLWGREPGGVIDLANVETAHLSPFFQSQDANSHIEYRRVWEEVKGIIESAVEIDRVMMCSKAIFQVHWRDDSQAPSRRRRFNPKTMEAVCYESDLSTESRVKFFISPILHKLGNADGRSYDRRMVLCKASVVCN